MDCVRVGLIGCGSVAESELDGLGQVRGARVVATADPVEQRARLLAHRAGGARAYSDYRRLLEDDEVDAVIISTPNFLHARQTIAPPRRASTSWCKSPWRSRSTTSTAWTRPRRDAGVTGMALMVMRFQSSYHAAQGAARQPARWAPRWCTERTIPTPGSAGPTGRPRTGSSIAPRLAAAH